MHPPASSLAPVPTSHESKWHDTTTISSGRSRPRSSRDDVGRVGVGIETRFHLQAHAQTLATGRQAREPLCVFGRDRGSRNLRDTGAVGEHAGVGRPQAVGSDRAHEHRDRAVLSRLRGAVGAVGDRLAVAAIGRVEQHDAPARLGAAALEFGEAADDEQVGLDAVARRADAHAETEHRYAVRARRDQVERLGAADPLRDLHGVGPDLVEAIGLHRRDRPRDGVFERLRAAQSMAERVGQQRETIPGELVRRGRRDHARDRLAIRVDERRPLRAHRRDTQ